MNIQYYGLSCFKITTKPTGRGGSDVTIIIDPFDASVGLRPPKGTADIVLSSSMNPDHYNKTLHENAELSITTPGEYAAKGVTIIALDSFADKSEGAERGRNTIYLITSEEIALCHMGDLGHELDGDTIDALGEVGILFVGIGHKESLGGKKAAELARSLEPNIVVPMHYNQKDVKLELGSTNDFCKENGNCPQDIIPKLTLKAKDLEGKSGEVVLMETN